MPHFHCSGIFEGDNLQASVSVLLAGHLIATCDFNWSQFFTAQTSQGCQTHNIILSEKHKTKGEFTYVV